MFREVVNQILYNERSVRMPSRNKEKEREQFLKFAKSLSKKSDELSESKDIDDKKLSHDYKWASKLVKEYVDEKY